MTTAEFPEDFLSRIAACRARLLDTIWSDHERHNPDGASVIVSALASLAGQIFARDMGLSEKQLVELGDRVRLAFDAYVPPHRQCVSGVIIANKKTPNREASVQG